MIRQAISCDVCGAEKKQTNHWFVASESGGELRLGGWNSRMRQRAGTKHLCGQTCLHKLVDDFIARTIRGRSPASMPESSELKLPRSDTDANLASPGGYREEDSSAKQVASIAMPVPSRPSIVLPAIVPMQPRLVGDSALSAAPLQFEDAPNYASRRWRAEAWERERNREQRATERHPETSRRHSRF